MKTLFRIRSLSLITAAILALLPFHALLTTWIGSNTGHLDLLRIWKELLIAGMALIMPAILWKDKKLAKSLFGSNVVRLIMVFAAIQLVFGVVALHLHQVNSIALIYALIINLRYYLFFLVVLIIARKDSLLGRVWPKILLIPASLVLFFGVLQKLFLPIDFLRHFGYGPKTIPAYQTVDSSLDYRRLQSTLRGANPLGAYLIPVSLGYIYTLKKQKLLPTFALIFCAIVLFYSYSRSAWLGLGLALLTLLVLQYSNRVVRRVALAAAGIVLVASCGLYLARNNPTVQDTILHTSSSSHSLQSSNSQRLQAEKAALHDVAKNPWGQGPGTAGPASFRNNHPPKIAENYYLQIAQEVGLIGLISWLGIITLVAAQLYRQKAEALPQLLLASLVGISLVNLVSHAWTDDTLSLLWWGLAGIALAPVILRPKHEQDKKS